jgi:ribonuclease HI
MLIRDDIDYSEVKQDVVAANDATTDWCAADLHLPGRQKPLRFVNLYVPPIRGGGADARVQHFDPTKIKTNCRTFVCGDLNCHAPSWDDHCAEDALGTKVQDWMTANDLVAANTGQHTRMARAAAANGEYPKSAPDVTVHHAVWDGRVQWRVGQGIGSDHLPLCWTITTGIETPEERRVRTKWCYRQADWARFAEEIEQAVDQSEKQESTERANEALTSIIHRAACRHIPRGARRSPKPFWCEEADELVAARQAAREAAIADPSPAAVAEWNEASRAATAGLDRLRSEKWKEDVKRFDLRTDSRKVFATIRALEGKTPTARPRATMERNGRQLVTDWDKAREFAAEYADVASLPLSEEDRGKQREFIDRAKMPCTCSAPAIDRECTICCAFKAEELNTAIDQFRLNKAPGMDEVTTNMMANLGPVARAEQLRICNLSWRRKEVPTAWRRAKIVPLLKTGKPPEKIESYRPISLTSSLSKLMEVLVKERLTFFLESQQKLSPNQAGFRRVRSTEDQVMRITQDIVDGFQAKPMKRTVMVLVDYKRAFDKVWHAGLLEKMLKLEVPSCFVQWTRSFLDDRYACVQFGSATSGLRHMKQGVPQGSVLSPLLFVIYINDILADLPPDAQISLFADDLAIWVQDSDKLQAEVGMQRVLDQLAAWADKWNMTISMEKTECCLFSTDPKEHKHAPNLTIGGTRVKHNPQPKFLGVTFDPQLTFSAHAASIKARLKSRLKPLRALTGKGWGCDKGILRALYKTFIRPVSEYCAAAYLPTASQTTRGTLKVQVNEAARIISGCTVNTNTDLLLCEAGVESLDDRIDYLTAVAYEKSLRLPHDNPRRACAQRNVQPRTQKKAWRYVAPQTVASAGLADCAREDLVTASPFAPWLKPSKLLFGTHLAERSLRTDAPDARKRAAERTLDGLQRADVTVWTDGSAEGGTRDGGSGALIVFNDQPRQDIELMCAAGRFTTSYRAELVALHLALTRLRGLAAEGAIGRGDRIRICTDSQSALMRLQRGPAQQRDTTAAAIWVLLRDLDEVGAHTDLQWVPGHAGLEGNERVDGVAKLGRALDQNAAPVDFDSAKAALKKHIRERRRLQLAATHPDARAAPDELEHGLPRRTRVLLARLRTGGRTPELASYRHFLTRRNAVPEPAECPHCGTGDVEDVAHLLNECPAFTQARLLWFLGLDGTRMLHSCPRAVAGFLRAVDFAER